jgi:recombination protein RecT
MAEVKTTPSGEIVQRRTDAPNLPEMLLKLQPEIARAVPQHIKPERMARIIMTAIRTVPKLAQCDPVSFLACVFSASQLGLEPNTPLGHAWLIPRYNSKTRRDECTLLIGYQGMMDLSYRSGIVKSIQARAVYEGDEFEYVMGLDPVLRHTPSQRPDREKQKVTHAWAIFTLRNGGFVMEVLSRAAIDARRARSASADRGPWVTDYAAMAVKSAIRAAWKYAPKTSEMVVGLGMDDVAEGAGGRLVAAVDPEVQGLLEKHFGPVTDVEEDENSPDGVAVRSDEA